MHGPQVLQFASDFSAMLDPCTCKSRKWVFLFTGSAYLVVLVVERSTDEEVVMSWHRQNEITIVMSLITTVVPNLFDIVSLLEEYHPRYRHKPSFG